MSFKPFVVRIYSYGKGENRRLDIDYGVKMKQCHRCKKWKAESEFYKKRKHKGGLSSWCKECEREYSRKCYKRDREPLKKYYSYEQRHRVVDGVKEKRCCRCRKWKDGSEFSKHGGTKDGLSSWCKKCQREYNRKYCKRDGRPLKKYYSYEQRHRVVDGVKEKRCRRCKKWKAESEFYRKRKHKDGLAVWCKKCADKAIYKSRKQRLVVRN